MHFIQNAIGTDTWGNDNHYLRRVYKTRDFFSSKPREMVQFLNVLFQEKDEVKKDLIHPLLLRSNLC